MILHDTPENIKAFFIRNDPSVAQALETARGHVTFIKRQVAEFQGAAIYALAKQYNRPGARFLEIGTAWGYSAALQALAAPKASIVTLNPRADESAVARGNLSAFANVTVVEQCSWDYLKTYDRANIDFLFVDGDHKNVRLDLPWWNRVSCGGLMLFHDYSPETSRRVCIPVFEALNEFKLLMGRDFDVSIIDDSGVGMVGWYKQQE